MKRFSKNLISILLSDIGRRLLGFLSVAYLARTIGAEGFGVVSIGLTVFSYALMVSSSGLNTYGIREIAKGMNGNFVNTMVSVRVLNAVIVLLVVTLVSLSAIRDTRLAQIIVLMCCSVLPASVHLDWVFQGKEEMHLVGWGRFLSAVISLAVLLLLVHTPQHLLLVAIASIAGDSIMALFLLQQYYKQRGGLRLRLRLSEWTEVMTHALPLGVGSLLAHFSINLPPIVIGIAMTASDVGIYSAGNKLVFFLLMLDRALAMMLLPVSSRLQAVSVERLASTLDIALKWILVTTLPIAVGGTLLADNITQTIFGHEFQKTAVVFQILIWYFVLTMIHTVYTSGVIAVGGEKRFVKIMSVSAIIYAITIVVGTFQFGVSGASAAIVVSEAVTVFLMRQQLHKNVSLHFPARTSVILLSAVLMGIIVWLLSALHLLIVISLAGISYVALLFVFRGVTKGDCTSLLQKL